MVHKCLVSNFINTSKYKSNMKPVLTNFVGASHTVATQVQVGELPRMTHIRANDTFR